jgi:NADH:ubiquinone oxidoreductase subunit 2 (subunit N)
LHFWVPDVYQGAWSSVSLWITILPKISVLGFWTHHWHEIWSLHFGNALSFFRRISMVVGRIAPLAQTNLKRLLAYSSIGHMGLLLMPLCSSPGYSGRSLFSFENISSSERIFETSHAAIGVLWAYMILYIFMNLGVWGLILQEIVRPPYKKYSGPQYLWDLKG